MSIETKITSLELENIKRIKAVQITPTASGLTIVGGKNNQGKHRYWMPSCGFSAVIATGRVNRIGKAL